MSPMHFDFSEVDVAFYDTANYPTYEDALKNGAIYRGERCAGYNALIDALRCAHAAATCLQHQHALRVRLNFITRDDTKVLIDAKFNLIS